MFAAVCSRPDIAFHIGRLSPQLQDPTERHANGIKELGRYLRATISQRIRFGPSESSIAIEPRDDPKSWLTLYLKTSEDEVVDLTLRFQ